MTCELSRKAVSSIIGDSSTTMVFFFSKGIKLGMKHLFDLMGRLFFLSLTDFPFQRAWRLDRKLRYRGMNLCAEYA